MNAWECTGRNPLPVNGVFSPSNAALHANGSAEGRSPLPGCGVFPPANSAYSTDGSAEGRSPLPEFGVSSPADSALYANGSAEGRSPLPGCGVSPQIFTYSSLPQAASQPRIALYWHNGRSLGHTVRCATLGHALLNQIPTSIIVGITGASKGFELLPPAMDLIKIPSYLTYDDTGGVRTTPVLTLAKKQFQRIRENLISTFVQDFQPHALIVDFHPEGKNGELIPTIIDSPKTHKVLGLRGILGSPDETNRDFFNPRLIAFIQKHFSAIHVYIDQQVFRLEDYYAIPNSLSAMFKYIGYVTRPTLSTKAEARALLELAPGTRIIVISFGGGQGTEPIWQAILRSLPKIQKHFDYAYLSAGPYLESGAYERLRTQVSQHPEWTWTRLLHPLPAWIKASDFFIGSGGYNSLAEIIATGANALIIPRQLNEREQEIHATKLAKLNIFRIAHLDTILSKDVSPLLEMCLKEPYPHDHKITIATNGARQSAQLIESIIV
jgi:predicted glycosyltransferase